MDPNTQQPFVLEDAVGFELRLQRAAREIRSAAGGRCCGDCTHARLSAGGSGYCSMNVNIEGNALTILYRGAPSCRDKFEPVSDS